ncbi:Misato segment II tubulin-like domain-containing protein [Suillus clintonianus]|uniref:Misato segment II tubulin-like domain-containing protein n=1 Tax=Suillus clintonianus TaxID=1904413 RepID=UPI001B876A21|nr:Misato segment II tubulin-like domain-containing protein [Suillus clintonianus]KAG2143689.1 Misato segment II tubulin-like domain-containing protein [Suillus clintonianus]
MREIIYIQAGSFANYTGTHFWNTQESYFTYDDDDEPIVNHDLSFEEGRSPQNQPTLCPRLLAFDQKSNFGTLAKTKEADTATDVSLDTTWRGRVVRETQDPIPQSEYHARLEGEMDEEGNLEYTDPNIRYWSDYSRVFLDRKSIQAIPDALESTEAGWSVGQELFRRYNEDAELMEGAFRLLVENCDNFQGLQMMNDTATFGGFSHAFLTSFRDEFLKASTLNFSFLSGADPNHAGIDNFLDTKRIINDALCLQSLHQLSDITFPILNPSRWSTLESTLSQGLAYDKRSLYHSSAIISSLVETATLPLRLKGSRDDIAIIADHLNWRKCSRFGQLGGIVSLPFPAPESTFTDLHCNFSTGLPNQHDVFARRNVTRGLLDQDLAAFDAWCDLSSLQEPLISSIHAPAYPVPTSFPSIFRHTKPTSMRMMSSLVTAPSTSIPLTLYARFVEQTARTRRSDGVLMSMGLESDDVKELASALWEIVDGYGSDRMAEGND